MPWQQNLIDDPEGLREILGEVQRIAVLGIKTEAQMAQPAFFVPEYLQSVGYEIIPVPVYYPDVAMILGKPVHRSLEQIPGEIDMVLVFRRSQDVAKHRDEILAARPKVVWMQTGIRNEEVARARAEAGIRVVQDRCAMIEHRRLGAERGGGRG